MKEKELYSKNEIVGTREERTRESSESNE